MRRSLARRISAAWRSPFGASCGRRPRRVWWKPSFSAVFHQLGIYVFHQVGNSPRSKGSTAHESLSCKQVYGRGAPHASSFCFSGERRRWRYRRRVLRSLLASLVLGLPLPLPRLSRRDRLKLGLALCSCYARAHVTCAVLMCKSPPSPRNIAQLLLLQVLALCRTKTLGNRSLQFSAPSTAATPRGDTDAGSRTMGVLEPWGSPARSKRRCEDREFSIGVGCVYPAVPGEPWLESASHSITPIAG